MPHSIVRQLTIRNTLIQDQSNSLPNCLQWTSKMISRHACLDNILALESVTSNDHPTQMPSQDRPATRLPVARYHYAPFIPTHAQLSRRNTLALRYGRANTRPLFLPTSSPQPPLAHYPVRPPSRPSCAGHHKLVPKAIVDVAVLAPRCLGTGCNVSGVRRWDRGRCRGYHLRRGRRTTGAWSR